MVDHKTIKKRTGELVARDWNLAEIKDRFATIFDQGVDSQKLSKEEIVSQKQEMLDRVQRRGEEYCYLTRNCARGSAAALLDAFGLGNMEVLKALCPLASPENLESYNLSDAREKCPLAPGLGARIAAEIIIEDMEKEMKSES